jgi:pilus assembly protein CpaD
MTRAYPASLAHSVVPVAMLRIAMVAVLAGALAGCYSARSIEGDLPDDARLRHPIALKDGETTVELFIGQNRGGLTARQRADVVAFVQAWRREATGGMLVEVPAGTPNERAAADSVPEVRALLAAGGVPASAIYVRTYHPANQLKLAAIRLNYPRIVAEAGPCGLWPADLGPGAGTQYWENQTYWNFGCAEQRNLASMVDDPADLVQPRGESPADNQRRTVVLDKYGHGQSPASVYPNPNAGKISDIGQ